MWLKRISVVLNIILFSSLTIQAQQAFQRLYSSEDRTIINLGCEPDGNEGFFLLNASIDPASAQANVEMIIISRHDKKGDIQWTREYSLKGESLLTNLKSTDISLLQDNTLLVCGTSVDLSIGLIEDSRFIFKIDPADGQLIMADVISNTNSDLLPVSFPFGIAGFEDDYSYFASHSNDDTLAVQRVIYNTRDSVIGQQSYFTEMSDMTSPFSALLDVQSTVDSNYLLCYLSDLFSTRNSLMTMSPDGSVLRATDYTLSTDSISDYIMQSLAVYPTPDTGSVQTGILLDLATSTLTNYLIKTDSIGNIEWSKLIEANALGFISQVNDVVYTSMNEIMITAKYIDLNTFGVGDYAIFFNSEGDVVRQWDYSSENSLFLIFNPDGTVVQFSNGEVHNMPDGGMVYSTVGLNPQTGNVEPYVIRTDALGAAFCQDTLDLPLVRDYAFISENVRVGTTDLSQVDTFEVQSTPYDGFTIPVLTLLDTFFCPQDPIIVDLNATTPGASSYEWSTGETTPVITVMEEGEFSVTVTIEDRICYTLCDTANISRREFPEAMIDGTAFGFCEIDSVLLEASSNNPITNIAWSTGDSTNRSIFVSEPGQYSVTITDFCDNQADATIAYSDFSIPNQPEIFDILASGRTCDGIALTPTVGGVVDGLTYAWSTGATSQSILVTDNGTYSLTVTNICGETDVFSIDIQSFLPISVQILDEGACDSLELIASVPPGSFIGPLSYEWSDGSTDNILDNLTSAGLYSVTVTDNCGEMASDEFAISDSLAFPTHFYPVNPAHPENRNFGAFIRCPDFFEGNNFRIEIYNRFGNKVFESDDVNVKWNGVYSGEFAPTDVYMYQYSYDIPGGETRKGEGTVTLFR